MLTIPKTNAHSFGQFINDPEMLAKLRLLAEGKMSPGQVMAWDPALAAAQGVRSRGGSIVPQAVHDVELKELQGKVCVINHEWGV